MISPIVKNSVKEILLSGRSSLQNSLINKVLQENILSVFAKLVAATDKNLSTCLALWARCRHCQWVLVIAFDITEICLWKKRPDDQSVNEMYCISSWQSASHPRSQQCSFQKIKRLWKVRFAEVVWAHESETK